MGPSNSADPETSEIFSSSRHALGFYRCVANTCRYSVPLASLRGRAIRHVLESAVASVVLAIPSLSVGIVGEDTSSPRFVQQPSVNIGHHFECLEAGVELGGQEPDLLRLLENQHDQSWLDVEHRPAWKLTVVIRDVAPKNGLLVLDAVFAVHHAIADGRSTAVFHARLLDKLNRPQSDPPAQLSGGILDITGTRKLVPPQEQLVKFTTSWGFLVRTLWRELGPAWFQGQQDAAPWTGEPITREACRTALRLVIIPAAAVPLVLAACRAHQTTLTAFLHSLALASFASRLPAEAAGAFRSSTPIDLRSFITNNDDPQPGGNRSRFGMFVSGYFHTYDTPVLTALREGLSEDKIWRAAADLRRDMKQHLDNMPRDDIMGMLGYVTDWQKFWLSKVDKRRQDTWEVSNIGSMPGGHGHGVAEGTTGGWKIERSIMSQGATVAGAAVSISVAGVVEGEISLALGWQEGTIETGTVDGLAEDLRTWLGRLGRGQPLV
ncbi:alcohol O-acetyltransferase 1 [Staphylotrichum tortipilum]|uniref:Alcohol O-acetyltransferase 1 n=1 Tax=Staphylotrichum tortipilum TaxID=2831512 RepID=A0AAN6MTM7_9PEZI|nr:alcohol O-acetyltransferase 1 [Staphylotrichum longicolle]